ncbi:hypothetical protein EXIGLDRAFT_225744 [Exidia glandulosa HHB12029]|uniref:Uncharacterized protein n=1 Tax=Exidia glandulosa HHB12029 TaxID=1314781 RepID=A0A165E9I4_EXIGL|nr:hypothetical protein EXIGLDRAFT_225744 [Exidia glandulosa HHB12029]
MKHHDASAEQVMANLGKLEADLIDKRTNLQRAIDKMEQEHQQQKAVARDLQLQLATLDHDLDNMRRKLSPIRTLPQDVLAHLFLLEFDSLIEKFARAMGSQNRPPKSSLDFARDFAFTVAAVSREWRTVALNTANLWTVISLELEDFVKLDDDDEGEWHTRTNAWKSHVDMCLVRSRTAPLYICLYEQTDDDSPNINDVKFAPYRAIMGKLLETASRWKVFYARIRHCLGGNSYVPLNFQAPTPLLERFMLCEDVYMPEERQAFSDPSMPVRFLPRAPRLRVLHFPNSLLRWGDFSASGRPAYFPDLRCLTIGGGGVVYRADWDRGGFALLKGCPVLETLVCNDMCPPFNHSEEEAFVPPRPDSEVIVMEHVTKVELNNIQYGLLQWWPVRLSFPALTTIALSDYCNTDAVHNVLAGLAASGQVRSLEAKFEGERHEDGPGVARLLGHFDHLDTVELQSFNLGDRDIVPLVAKRDSESRWTLCPKLRRLELNGCSFADERVARSMVDLVEKRALHGPRDPRRDGNGDAGLVLLEEFVLRQIEDRTSVPLWLPGTIGRILRGEDDE